MKKLIALALALAVLLALTACGKTEPVTDETEPATEKTEPVSESIPYTEPTETDAPTEPEPDYSAAYVTDAAAETFEFDGMTLEYHVPEIVFDGEGIDYLNEMLYQQLYEDVYKKDVVDAMNEYGMPGVAYIVYHWGISDAFLSIVAVITPYASEGAEFTIYNVDLRTGQLASQTELLNYFGYTVEAFNERAKDVMGTVLLDQYESFLEDPSMKLELDDLLRRTTSEEYVNDACPFVGADGTLWMIAPIASIAGADRYMQLINFADYPISEDYLHYGFG